MSKEYRRRKILATAGSAGIIVLAGCSGGDDTEPTDTADVDGDDSGDGAGMDEQNGTATGEDQADGDAVYADDHLRIVSTEDGYRLEVPGWPDAYVGTAEHRHLVAEGSQDVYPVQYEDSGGDGLSMEGRQYRLVTPGFHTDSFLAPFVWGDEFFEPDTPQLDVWYVPAGEDVYDREIIFRDQLPEDIYTRIDDTPWTVAHIDPTRFGWTNDPEPGEELWVHLVGEERVEEVDLSYTWGNGQTPTPDTVEEGMPLEDADPEALLPSIYSTWETGRDGQRAAAGPVEDGHWRDYIGPRGNRYSVDVLRFESEDAAAEAPSEWQIHDESPVYVPRGNFGFGAGFKELRGDPEPVHFDRLVNLLSHSPALTQEYVRNNNLNQ